MTKSSRRKCQIFLSLKAAESRHQEQRPKRVEQTPLISPTPLNLIVGWGLMSSVRICQRLMIRLIASLYQMFSAIH